MPETPKTPKACQKCDGKGYYSGWLLNLGTLERVWHAAIACDAAGCRNGVYDSVAYLHSMGCGPCPHGHDC